MMKSHTVLFRADSSSIIGTGHIMRDLVLASQFEDANIIFAVQDLHGNINHKILEKNYTLEVLQSNNMEELLTLIKKHSIDMVIIDHYGIDYDYEKALKKETGVLLMALDDMYEKHHCDILLNHNVCADETRYKGLVPEQCELRCGSKYTLLRDEFIQEKQKAKNSQSNQKKVFIAMGGADHSNITIEILKVFKNSPDLFIDVVTTTANAHLDELKAYTTDNNKIALHINTNKIAQLMHEADFAIITPSVTVNEVIYMKLPFIAIQTAENQYEIAQYLQNRNFLVFPSYDERVLIEAIKTINDEKKYQEILDNIKLVLEDRIDR